MNRKATVEERAKMLEAALRIIYHNLKLQIPSHVRMNYINEVLTRLGLEVEE